jgi:hypothetical protein
MLRVWAEDLGEGQTDWRGQVEHVTSGQVHYFRDWARLITLLQEMLGMGEAASSIRPDETEGGG